jgi:plasmid stabilization system protein ParE
VSQPITIRRAAQQEYDKAVDWYEQQRPGLGAEFIRRVKEQLDAIEISPLAHAVAHRDIRKAVVQQFPYTVYYRALKTKTVVVSIFNDHRNPRDWQSRS